VRTSCMGAEEDFRREGASPDNLTFKTPSGFEDFTKKLLTS
jgi:hypothetical protein